MDRCALRIPVEHLDCGNWLGMAWRFGANSLCGGTRFLYARLAWQDSPEVRHAVRRADCPRFRLADSGGDQFLFYGRRSAGNVSEVAVPRRRASINPLSLHVRRVAENRLHRFLCKKAL